MPAKEYGTECEHKSASVLYTNSEHRISVEQCTWGCGGFFLRKQGDDGVSKLVGSVTVSVESTGEVEEKSKKPTGKSLAEHTKQIEDYEATDGNPVMLSEMYNDRGVAFGNAGEYAKEMEDYKKAISLNPDCAKSYYNVAVTFHAKGGYDDAVHWYSKAIEADEYYTNAYFNRRLVYSKIGKRAEAEADRKRAAELRERNI